MGVYGGKGPMVNGVLWFEVFVFALFVALRVYTRKAILNSVGPDDYIVVIALVLQIAYTALVSVSTRYGLGQLYEAVGDPATYYKAVEYELFSQVAGLMVIGVGKLAVGGFLLRIVRNRFHIIAIWVCLAITSILTVFASIVVVIQCLPVERSWNPTVKGHCWIDFSKVGYTVGSWFVAADFCFAILPWFVVWDLNMKQKDKITVACGLSLGIFAGICGIVRTVALAGLNGNEYIYSTVGMLIWSATESCVTIMCSSIPVLRPLYTRIKHGSKGSSSGNTSYKLPMYASANRKYGMLSKTATEPRAVEPDITYQEAVIKYSGNNNSDEHILRGVAGIERTDEVTVSYEPGQAKI